MAGKIPDVRSPRRTRQITTTNHYPDAQPGTIELRLKALKGIVSAQQRTIKTQKWEIGALKRAIITALGPIAGEAIIAAVCTTETQP